MPPYGEHYNVKPASLVPDLGAHGGQNPASAAYISGELRTPERRAEYIQARAALPAAGLKAGKDIESRTAATWLPAQRSSEQRRY